MVMLVNLAPVDPILKDIENETIRLLKGGLSDAFHKVQRRWPNFDCNYKGDNARQGLSHLLIRRLVEWNVLYVYGHVGPLTSADKDPPSDFVAEVPNWINEEKESGGSCARSL